MRRSVVLGVLAAVLLGLLVPAAALTALRVVDPTWVLAVQYVAFTPAALVLYAAALVLLVVLALRSAGRRRSLLAAGAVLVLLPLGAHAAWFAPQLAGAQPAAPPGAPELRVITSNLLRGDGDVREVVEAARVARADLVVLSEATGGTARALDRLGADESWPYRAGRVGRDIEGTLVLSADPVRDVRRLPTELDSWALTVDTGSAGARRALSVLAVHPIAPYEGAADWQRDHDAIWEAVRAEDPDVVLGDFNATVDHLPMRRLAEAGLRTATERANEGWRPTWPVNGLFRLGGVPLPRSAEIDHVLVTDDVHVVATERHRIAGTDHLALSADLRLG